MVLCGNKWEEMGKLPPFQCFADQQKLPSMPRGGYPYRRNTGIGLTARCGGHLICNGRLAQLPADLSIADWEETERKLMRLPSLNETAQKLRGLLMGYATDLELDGHCRVLIPKEHREFADLDRQAMMFGQGNKLNCGMRVVGTSN